jgi:hypothetical protein
MTLAAQFPRRVDTLAARRPVLQRIGDGLEALEAALDAERRQLIREDESRISRYMQAAEQWASSWPRVSAEIESLPLWEAHQFLVQRAETILPFHVSGASP